LAVPNHLAAGSRQVVDRKEATVALSYLLGTGGIAMEPTGTGFYEQYDVMRRWCENVQSQTGCEMPELFTEDYTLALFSDNPDGPREPADLSVRPDFLYRGGVRQAAYVIGIADILAEQGIYPDLLVGTSFGGMIAACLAGSLEREELFRLVEYMAEFPLAPEGEPARGVAYAELPFSADLDWYCGETRPNVYLAGSESRENSRILMFSGYLKDLEDLAAEAPSGHVPLVIGAIGGLHTPLQQFVRDLLEPHVNDINFRDPEIPLLSGVGGAQLKTGEDVRRDILDNFVEPVGVLTDLIGALDEFGMEMALTVGTALPSGPPPSPFPVLQAAVPEDIGQIMTAIYDLGIDVKAR
jgi:[acyl-carrier-protein] S-malonyltransferase